MARKQNGRQINSDGTDEEHDQTAAAPLSLAPLPFETAVHAALSTGRAPKPGRRRQVKSKPQIK
jgi:hypothetical protein